MSKKITIPKSIKAYGYTGVWRTGQVGWFSPHHIGGTRKYPDEPSRNDPSYDCLKGERLFLCEITAKPVIDKLGRPITKIIK